jgi:cyclase
MSMTRRRFLASSAAATVVGALARASVVRAWQGAQAPPAQPVFTPIRRNIGFFTMRGGTIGYLVDPAAVVVVDSQYPAEGQACLDGLNARSNSRPVDALVNTHHHGDHTGGNIAFKGSARRVVAHARAAELMRNPPGMTAPAGEQLYPDTTFTDTWGMDAGGERVRAAFHGPAHTSGDVVVTFERANVAHMGDLMFNRRHPIVDRAAGASIRNWIGILERVPREHAADTIYIFGHAGAGQAVTGGAADLAFFRDYLTGLMAFVAAQIKAGRSRDDILAMRDPLKGFESVGRFGAANPRDPLTVAYEELTSGG